MLLAIRHVIISSSINRYFSHILLFVSALEPPLSTHLFVALGDLVSYLAARPLIVLQSPLFRFAVSAFGYDSLSAGVEKFLFT